MKTYKFSIRVWPATRVDGGWQVEMGLLAGAGIHSEEFTGTLAQAVARRQTVSDGITQSHVAMLLVNRSEPRKPAGFGSVRELYADRRAAA